MLLHVSMVYDTIANKRRRLRVKFSCDDYLKIIIENKINKNENKKKLLALINSGNFFPVIYEQGMKAILFFSFIETTYFLNTNSYRYAIG